MPLASTCVRLGMRRAVDAEVVVLKPGFVFL
jgi:hypothetical protein